MMFELSLVLWRVIVFRIAIDTISKKKYRVNRITILQYIYKNNKRKSILDIKI